MTTSNAMRRAMGTTATVLVNGGGVDALAIIDEIDRLERRWTRFRPTSELQRMNDAAGVPTVVSASLYTLVDHLVAAHRFTGGRFDPTLEGRMVALGYDRTYRELGDDLRPLPAASSATEATAGCDEIVLVPEHRTVWLPNGVRLDPGGLGKGLAADLAADLAMAAGADGVLVDLGGDIVTRGVATDGGPWRIDVPATPDHPERVVELSDGAVATSDTGVRTWTRGGVRVGHLLDPATGLPLHRELRATVVAGSGWWAEAAATAAIVATARGERWVRDLVEGGSTAAVYVSEYRADHDAGQVLADA